MTIADDSIAGRMARIRSIHEYARQAAASEPDDETLIALLDGADFTFRSVAYEGAAMGRGLADIASGAGLERWSGFMQRTRPHAVQVHIGLGWALAQRQLDPMSYIAILPPVWQARVLDGMGFYEGMFRNRTTIRDKAIPAVIPGPALYGFDQGVGRALWYLSGGQRGPLARLLDGFPAGRLADLWRGIGIASAYVGGLDGDMLKRLFDMAGAQQVSLGAGAVFLAHSRLDAGTLTADSDLACRRWCHMPASDAVSLMDRTQPSGASYIQWVREIEKGLAEANPRSSPDAIS